MAGWLKLHYEIVHDPKIRALAFEDRWHFVALLCAKGEGLLDEPQDVAATMVEVTLGLHGKDLESLKQRLLRLRLIDENWHPRNWEKRQESKDKTAAERMRKYRESKKKSDEGVTDTRNVTGRYGECYGQKKEVRSKNKKNSQASPDSFDVLWSTADPSLGEKGVKHKARSQWSKLPESIQDSLPGIYRRQAEYKRAMKAAGGFAANFPHLERWIRDKRFEDEVQAAPVGSGFDWSLVS